MPAREGADAATRRARGQYFTPAALANLMLDVLERLGAPLDAGASLIDPACGEGVFLAEAARRGFRPPQLFGRDSDPGLREAWRRSGLDRLAQVAIADGLRDDPATAGQATQFDLVIGNPPFGPDSRTAGAGRAPRGAPIEQRFAERFVALARPGGFVAIILPDGALANRSAAPFRARLFDAAEPLAIVSLSRSAFVAHQANAKTSALFLRLRILPLSAYDPPSVAPEPAGRSGTLLLFEAGSRLDTIAWPPRVAAAVPLAVLQNQRWDVGYWHPRWAGALEDLASRCSLRPLGDFLPASPDHITYGSTRPRLWCAPGAGARYVTCSAVRLAGLYPPALRWTPKGGPLDRPRCRVSERDVIVNKSGLGTWGRAVCLARDWGPMVVSQDTMRLRPVGYNPFLLAVYLWTRFGHGQIERHLCGVAAPHLDFDEMRAVRVPEVSVGLASEVEEEYRRIAAINDTGDQPAAETRMRELVSWLEAELMGEGRHPRR